MNRPSAPAGLPTVTSVWPVRVALALLLAALAALLAWQYAMPRSFDSTFLLDHAGVEHFRAALGLPSWTVALGPYRAGFRALLGLAWAAYFVLVFAGGLGGPLPRRRALSLTIVAVALVAAVLWPPSFSCDVYGYVGYARMKVLYGLNPYVTTQHWLIEHHDATGPFVVWNITSPYGPLWTTLSIGLVKLLHGSSLYVQVVAMKLVGAGALVAAAWLGGRVADRLAPGRGELTRLAIGLNPLFVIEAAGNAHNDFVMMALVVAVFAAALDGRTLRAVLLAGVAGAIKFLPLLLVPWMVLADWRARALPWRQRAKEGVAYVLAALLPIALAFWPYWAGARTMLGLQQRWRSHQTTATTGGVLLWTQSALFLAIYGGVTLWVLRGEKVRMLTAWVIVAAVIYMVMTGVWLPWYLCWIWVVALLDWNRRSTTFSYMAFCFAVVLTFRYSITN
jgi:hypothetical protein